MKLKVAQGVYLTQEQTIEVGQIVMQEPDMGWNYDSGTRSNQKTGVYDVVMSGEHGTYEFRVNLSFQLITLKSVK